jgi:hypothetical protein
MTDMKRLGAVLLLVATGLVAAGPALGQTATVVEYQRLIAQVCQKKITPEMVRLYEAAEKELDAARARGEQQSNFFGLRDPQRAYDDCMQGTGVTPR